MSRRSIAACEHSESVAIAPLRPFHELPLHAAQRLGRNRLAALPSMAVGWDGTVPEYFGRRLDPGGPLES